MSQYLVITCNIDYSLRVVRKGYHYEVESKWKHEAWEGIYRVAITQELDAEINALRGALRKALYIGCDYYPEAVRSIFDAGNLAEIRGLKDPEIVKEAEAAFRRVSHLPRNEPLNLRIPKELKARLEVAAAELTRKTGKKHSKADVAIMWMERGGLTPE